MCGNEARAHRSPDVVRAEADPKGQVLASLAVLVPVALSGLALVAFAPESWWIFTTYFWVAFPAFRLLTSGVAGLSNRDGSSVGGGEEQELLEALHEHGELTPARAAMETSLTVSGADGMLKGLAEGGHLEVRVRGGGLSYALWETMEGGGPRGEIRGPYGEPKLGLLEPHADGARRGLERSEV